jgi:hypothetical protein
MKLYEIDNQWLNECNREQIILRLWPDGASYAIESLSKITKYEDVYTWQFLSKTISAHIEFWVTGGCSTCLPLWIHVPLFMNASLITLHSPSKTARHETISRLCYSAFVQNQVHNEERRRDFDSSFMSRYFVWVRVRMSWIYNLSFLNNHRWP